MSTEAATIAELARAAHEPVRVVQVHDDHTGEARPILIDEKGAERATSLEGVLDTYRMRPRRFERTDKIARLDSLIDYLGRYGTDDTVAFVSDTRVEAVIDLGGNQNPNRAKHRVIYEFPFSPEWKGWTSVTGRPLSQTDFAQIIEDHVVDIADPATALEGAAKYATLLRTTYATPARMMELSRGLTVRSGARVQQHTRLSTGEASIAFELQHTDEDGKPLTIPGLFLLALPVFVGGAAYQVPVRLRFSVKDGSIAWRLEPWRLDAIKRDAIGDIAKQIAEAEICPVLHGVPA